jgi:predicted nucleic acid-binding protein
MPDSVFVDSNVLLYALDKDSPKQAIAFSIWRRGVIVSTQVVMELTNVCIRKLKMPREIAFENALNIMEAATVKPLTDSTIRLAFGIALKYGFSHWDCLIVASALECNCQTLCTEDLQHNQLIEGKLKIINPFL